MLSIVLLLLPLATAAPTPQGFPTGLTVRSLVTCSPTICDPPEPDLFPSHTPIFRDPPIIGCDPRICDPPEFGLDIGKRSQNPDSGSYAAISTTTLAASALPVRAEPDNKRAVYDDDLVRDVDGIIKSKRGWIPDRDGLVKDEGEKSKPKRALEPLSPDQWGAADSGSTVKNGAIKRAGSGGVIEGNGKKAVDSEVEQEDHTGIGNGIVIGSKEKRDVESSGGISSGGRALQLDTVSDTEEEGDVVGNGLSVRSKLHLKREAGEADGAGSSGGRRNAQRTPSLDEESGDNSDDGIVIGSKLKPKLKRDSIEESNYGTEVGNGNAMQKRSIVGVGTSPTGNAKSSGVSIGNQ